jgi:hypothetical protein
MGLRIGVDKLLIGKKAKKGSGLNQTNITDAMMEEDVDFYMASEDEADVYLQLVEE